MENNLTKEKFDDVFKLMKKSFPESEYRPYEKQLNLVKIKEYKIHPKYNENGDLIAFVALWDFPEFIFVEHLAVSPLCRGMGIGTKIMEELIKKYNKQVILEIEPPQNDISIKRCKFYERLGFHICNYEYYQKPLRKGQSKLRLNLMSYPNPLDKESFNHVNNYLHQRAYQTVS